MWKMKKLCNVYVGDGDFCQKQPGHEGFHNDMAPRCGAINGEFVCDKAWWHAGDHYGSVRLSWEQETDD